MNSSLVLLSGWILAGIFALPAHEWLHKARNRSQKPVKCPRSAFQRSSDL